MQIQKGVSYNVISSLCEDFNMKINRSIQFIGRLITAIIILGITAFFTPGFNLESIWTLVIAIAALSIVDFCVGCFTKLFYHPFAKFFIGAILAGVTLYLVQYFTIGYILSLISIILGAIVFGLVDYMLPSEDMEEK